MNSFLRKLPHYGDILAIPFFLLTFIYFYNLENKTWLEYGLLIFSLCGFVLDMLFTYLFFTRSST